MFNDALKVWRLHSKNAQKDGAKAPLIQAIEILIWKFRGFGVIEYYMYPLYKGLAEPVLCMNNYVKREQELNPRQSGVVPFDKWIQAFLWKGGGLAHAEVYGCTRAKKGQLLGSIYNGTTQALSSFLGQLDFPVVIKPMNAANGLGFDLITGFDSSTQTISMAISGELDVETFQRGFADTDEGYVYQRCIRQHPVLAKVHPTSVNTLRVVTHVDNAGNHSVIMGIVKFGGGEKLVDNSGEGILAKVEINSGRVGEGVMRFGSKRFDTHPDTGVEFKGMEIPHWRAAIELALRAHSLVPYPRSLGWDIAIEENGPVIIEMNAFLSWAANQKACGPSVEALFD